MAPAFPSPLLPPAEGVASPAVAAVGAAASGLGAAGLGADAGAAGRAALLAQPSALHPSLWLAQSQGGVPGGPGGRGGTLPSGFAALDAELPGGGWPVRVLTELLLPVLGVGELRLLAPVLIGLARAGRSVLLFDPPALVNAVALAEMGWPPGQCVVVRSGFSPLPPPVARGWGLAVSAGALRAGAVIDSKSDSGSHSGSDSGSAKGAVGAMRAGGAAGFNARRGGPPGGDLCWAIEQALRSGQVGAVLAWPGAAARPEALRRMQLAAQSHEGPVFLLRALNAQTQPSPAPLRLVLQPAGGGDVSLQVVKRRGPAMAQPLRLKLAPVLSERAWARAAAQGLVEPADAPVTPLPPALAVALAEALASSAARAAVVSSNLLPNPQPSGLPSAVPNMPSNVPPNVPPNAPLSVPPPVSPPSAPQATPESHAGGVGRRPGQDPGHGAGPAYRSP